MQADRYEICEPNVVSDVIDGEAVIMHLKSGHYFSTRDVACLIWQAVEERQSVAEIRTRILTAYDADDSTIDQQIRDFLQELQSHDLIRAAAATAPGMMATGTMAEGTQRLPYAPPILSAYTDMEDLLTIDPIHDVDPVGWPTRKAEFELD